LDIGALISGSRSRVVSALAARFRDLDLAEDAFSDAALTALAVWPADPPRDPAAWLWRAALRRGLDAVRRARTRATALHDSPPPEPTPEDLAMLADAPIPDERLRLIFVCCHPALAPEARAALTLKVVCGLSTERLARAFLVGEPAMLQRITRAKRKIAAAGVPFEVPARAAWAGRLAAVLATLEIAYAQAYEDAALAGDAAGFGVEVLRLSGLLVELLPDDPEVLALAALVRFAEARRPARLDDAGAMVPLDQQDVSQWNARMISEGARLLDRAAGEKSTGPYRILAAIHGAHLARRESGATPWPTIAALYDALIVLRPGPVTAVNRAVAVGMAQGPDAGLAALAAIRTDRDLKTWLPWQAARAGLCEQAGRSAETLAALDAALALGPAPAERLYLARRRAVLSGAPGG
jgi:RNA polymerase sigma-70 factor (ECF subfamily)